MGKYYYLRCQSVLKGTLESETIMNQLVSKSHRVEHLGGVNQKRLHMVDNMVWNRIILRELVGLILSWLGLGILVLCVETSIEE